MSVAVLAVAIAFLPLLKPAGPGNTAPVDLLLVLFLFTSALGLSQRRRPLQVPAGAAILVILVGSLLALIASVDAPTGLLTLVVDVYLFCLFIAVANEVDSERALRLAMTVWVVSALVWATILIGGSMQLLPAGLQEFVGASAYASQRSAGTTGNPNMAASYMVTSCFIALSASWPRRRFARVAVLGWLLTGMYVTGSNGALAAFLVGLAVLGLGAYLRSGRSREQIMGLIGAATLAGAILIGVVVSLVGIPTIGVADVDALAQREQQGTLARNIGRLDHGINDRLFIWGSGWRGAAPRLAIGVGPGEAVNYAVDLSGLRISLHNDPLAYLLERGVLGLLGFLALHKALLGWGGRLLVTEGRTQDVMRGLGPAVAANLVFSLSHETLHFRHVWLLYAMVWAACAVVSRRQRAAGPQATAAPQPRATAREREPERV
jgi:O-antigen ligase